jgi:hypothetical protein
MVKVVKVLGVGTSQRGGCVLGVCTSAPSILARGYVIRLSSAISYSMKLLFTSLLLLSLS